MSGKSCATHMAILRRNATPWRIKGNPAVVRGGASDRRISSFFGPASGRTVCSGLLPSIPFRFFLGRSRFKGPLAPVLARARIIRRWSIFHKEPPSNSFSRRRRRGWSRSPGGFPIRSPPDPWTVAPMKRAVEHSRESIREPILLPVCVSDIERLSFGGVNSKMGNSGKGPLLPLSL